jgi:hypothetical protein
MTNTDTAASPAHDQSSAETRTGCVVVHQYDGDEACQSSCTLDFGHDGPHVCGNGHDF